jgi:hypothetical protein
MGAPAGIDWEWALRSKGVLSARQKRQLLAPLARIVARYPAARLRLATGRRGKATIDLDALRIPDSALATAAREEARELVPDYLLEHSYRTWIFGLLLAQVARARVDDEVVFVASVLHDVTLGKPTPGRCFAVTGGEHAHRFCLDHGADETRAALVGAAVAGHITVGASEDLGDPAGFVSAGAFADLTGVGLQHAPADWVDGVLERHPRHDLRPRILADWNADARGMPDGRGRWLNRYAGFPALLRLSPFED